MKRVRKQSPSTERRLYYLWCYPDWDTEYRTWRQAKIWTRLNALHYRNSNLLYPRNIFFEESKTPLTELERFLLKVDHAMIDAVTVNKSDPMILFGKWLLFVDRKNSNATWSTIVDEITKRHLPYRAKISTAKKNTYLTDKPKSKHMICIYTPNYLWRENVREVRFLLKEIGFRTRLYYKPDIFSVLEAGSTRGTHFNRALLKRFKDLGLAELKVHHRYFG
jgi:hypothetical protein